MTRAPEPESPPASRRSSSRHSFLPLASAVLFLSLATTWALARSAHAEWRLLTYRPSLAAAGGLALSALLTVLAVALARGRTHALESARLMAQELALRSSSEAALRESEARAAARAAELEAVLDAVPAAVLITHDRNARWIDCNKIGCELMGMPPRSNGSKAPGPGEAAPAYGIFLHGAEVPAEELPVQLAAARGVALHNAKYDLHLENGAVRHILMNSAPLRDASGGLTGAVAAFVDVTELEDASSRLMQADRLASVGMVAAGVAHEINNPLAYVIASLGFVEEELARLGPDLPEARWADLREAVADAHEGAQRVTRIVRDLNAFSRPEDDRKERLELLPALERAVHMAAAQVKARARLVTDYGPTPAVLGSAGRLGQVFLNLVVNAAQAIPDGETARHEVRVSTRTDGAGRAVVEVRDTGCGMSSAILARIFEPFFTTKPLGVGTGLGLSICRNIVSKLGGELFVESEPGRGTTFQVVLPPAPQAASAADRSWPER